jgi:hypothetical protein
MTQLITVELSQVLIGHEPRTTADGNRGSHETKLTGRRQHQAAPRHLNWIMNVTAASHLRQLGM